MMSGHFHMGSEHSGAIAKGLPHAKNQPSVPGSFFNQFVTEIYILVVYIRIYTIFEYNYPLKALGIFYS